jgi:hypothetical protein
MDASAQAPLIHARGLRPAGDPLYHATTLVSVGCLVGLGLFGMELARRRMAGLLLTSSWAIVDSNHGPPPYQSGALTN